MPQAIVERWHREMVTVLDTPEIKQAPVDRGIDAAPTTPAKCAAYLRSETSKRARVAKSAGLQAN